MARTENRRINIWINGKEVENSGKAIRAEFNKARIELNKANKSASDYQQKLKRFKDAKSHLQKHNDELRGVSRSWQQFKTIAAGVLGANLIQGAMSRLSSFVRGLVVNNAKLSDSYADVMKFTGLTRQETEKLSSDFKSFNTRTPRSELLDLAKVAGRIGIEGANNIKEFVREANQINVALGEDLGEDAVLQIGKIASAFDTSMLKIGSAINTAGQNSKAQEQYLVDFTARMQGTGVTAGISADEIIGYGAVLDSLGQRVEMSGTALNNFFIDFVKDTEKFGKAAGMANGELSKLVGEEGTNEGFIAFMEALKATNPEKDKFLKKLEELGINGARGAQVFLALSNNLDEVRRMQALSNDAFEKGTSITEEYNIRNENLAANLEKVQQWLNRLFVNSTLMKQAERWVNLFAEWVNIPVSETMQKEVYELRAMEMQLYDTNTTSEQRVKIIEDLQSKYPDYLGNLDAETATNEELSKAIALVNDELVNKLVLQKKLEQVEDKAENVADNRIKLLEMETELREKLVSLADKHGLTIDKNLSLADQARSIQKQMANQESESVWDKLLGSDSKWIDVQLRNMGTIQKFTDDQSKSLAELRQEYNSLLGNTGDGEETESGEGVVSNNATTPTGGGSGSGMSDAEKKALEKKREEYLKAEAELRKALDELRVKNIADEEQRAIDQAALDYQRRQKEIADSVASEQTKNQLLAEEKIAFENTIDAITAEFEQKRKDEAAAKAEQEAAEKQLLDEALMSERELEIQQVNEHYDKLIKLAEKHGADTTALETKRRNEIQAINDKADAELIQKQMDAQMKRFQDIKNVTTATTGTLMAMMNLMGAGAEQMNDFQKASALFSMGINLAEGLMNSANMASKAPEPITAAAIFTSMAGMLYNTMSQAKQVLSSEKEPKYQPVKSAPRYRRGMRWDGVSHDSSYGGNPILDPRDGSILGTLEKNETLLSAATSKNNPVVDALLNSSLQGGDEVDLMPFAMAQNQARVDFDSLDSTMAGGSQASGNIAALVASAVAPALEEIRRIKEKPAIVQLSRIKDAESEMSAVQELSGKKMN